MSGSSRVRSHIRGNVYGLLAIFIALGGTAVAAQQAAKNSVTSKSIKNAGIKGKDVDSSQVQLRVGDSCAQGQAIRVVNADGTVGCETDDAGAGGGSPSGPAGGDLNGAYPNPSVAETALDLGGDLTGNVANAQIGPDTVGSPEVGSLDAGDIADTNTLDGDEVNEAGLTGSQITGVDAATVGGVPPAQLGAVGSSARGPSACADDDEDGEACVTVSRTLARPARVLLSASSSWMTRDFDDSAGPGASIDYTFMTIGTCSLTVDGVFVTGSTRDIGEIQTSPGASPWTLAGGASVSTGAVTNQLAAGPHTFQLVCTEADGDIEWDGAILSAVVLSSAP